MQRRVLRRRVEAILLSMALLCHGGRRQQQIPCRDDNKKGKAKANAIVEFARGCAVALFEIGGGVKPMSQTRDMGHPDCAATGEQQIPFGDDNSTAKATASGWLEVYIPPFAKGAKDGAPGPLCELLDLVDGGVEEAGVFELGAVAGLFVLHGEEASGEGLVPLGG
jgi:hypothetical protein